MSSGSGSGTRLRRIAAELAAKVKRWYRGGDTEDAAIRERFADTVAPALAGELDAWAGTPRGRLASILLLDQMTRSMFRGTSRAFAGDTRARRLALEMLGGGEGIDQALPLRAS